MHTMMGLLMMEHAYRYVTVVQEAIQIGMTFDLEVADLARLNHENVGKLLGYCIEGVPFTRVLVFEYVSNGTLSEHLHC
ncbi:hypothetical protein M8C21_018316, partial [Ambrosia artemisiifolia]